MPQRPLQARYVTLQCGAVEQARKDLWGASGSALVAGSLPCFATPEEP